MEKTVTVKGRDYLVRTLDGGQFDVFAIVRRDPVNPRGFYQNDTVYRRVKSDGAKGRAAIREATAALLRA